MEYLDYNEAGAARVRAFEVDIGLVGRDIETLDCGSAFLEWERGCACSGECS